MKILSLGLYLDIFSIVFQNFDFWPFYGLFYRYFLAFFGYLLSVNELQVTHFDPGTLYFENIIFRSISRQIFNSFSKFWFLTIIWPFLGIFCRFSGIFCPSTQEHNIWKILSLGLYLDTFSIVFQILIATGHTFWPRIFFLKICI